VFTPYVPPALESIVPLPARPRRFTLRLVAFVLLIVPVFGGGAVAVVTYARDSYFVALGAPGAAPPSQVAGASARPLLIYKGRPGGLLWFKPTLAQRTQVLSTQVLPARLPDLQKGRQEPSLAAARTYVANLVQEAAGAASANPGSPTGAESTTTSP
jgi:protein phosphatase